MKEFKKKFLHSKARIARKSENYYILQSFYTDLYKQIKRENDCDNTLLSLGYAMSIIDHYDFLISMFAGKTKVADEYCEHCCRTDRYGYISNLVERYKANNLGNVYERG